MKIFISIFVILISLTVGFLAQSIPERAIIVEKLRLSPSTLPSNALSTDGDTRIDVSDMIMKRFHSVSGWESIGPLANPVNEPDLLQNISLSASVSSNNLTVCQQTDDGGTPSSSDPVKIAFRNSTLTTGTYSLINGTSTACVTIPSGGTLGTRNSTAENIYVYAINNSGTITTGLSGIMLDESTRYTSVTVGTGSDLSGPLYSPASVSNAPIRLIGKLVSTQSTAGTWASAVTINSPKGFHPRPTWENWYIDAHITCTSNTALGITNATAYANNDTTDTDLTLTVNNTKYVSDINAYIPCADGTASSGANCGGVNEAYGITFTVPAELDQNIFRICYAFGIEIDVAEAAAAGFMVDTFQILQFADGDDDSIIAEGNERTSVYLQKTTITRTISQYPVQICGNFQLSSGTNSFRLGKETGTSGTVTQNNLICDANTSYGQRNFHITAMVLR